MLPAFQLESGLSELNAAISPLGEQLSCRFSNRKLRLELVTQKFLAK